MELAFAESWIWLDWVALSLLAYGVTAGFMRGFIDQSIRLLLLFGALVVATLLDEISLWIGGQLSESASAGPPAVVSLVLFCLVALVATSVWQFLRVVLPGGGEFSFGSRVGGALLGALAAVLLTTGLAITTEACGGQRSNALASSIATPVARTTDQLPAWLLPAFLGDPAPLPQDSGS